MGGRAEYSTRIFKPRRYCSALPAGEQTRGRPMMRGEAIRACQLGGRIEIERDRERERESPRETTVGLITRLLLPPRCVPSFLFPFFPFLSFNRNRKFHHLVGKILPSRRTEEEKRVRKFRSDHAVLVTGDGAVMGHYEHVALPRERNWNDEVVSGP